MPVANGEQFSAALVLRSELGQAPERAELGFIRDRRRAGIDEYATDAKALTLRRFLGTAAMERFSLRNDP
jgi:hypothetical protein